MLNYQNKKLQVIFNESTIIQLPIVNLYTTPVETTSYNNPNDNNNERKTLPVVI